MEPVEQTPEVVSQVNAFSGARAIRSYNSAGERISIGSLMYQDYGDDRTVRGIWLDSTLDNKVHKLGAVTQKSQVIHHADVIEPFLESGFKVQEVLHARGGASCLAVLSNPEITFPDPIIWDQKYLTDLGLYAGSNFPTNAKMEISALIRTDLRKGHGVSVELGFFRLICTNGLVASVLDMGSMRSSHSAFSVDQINDFLEKHLDGFEPKFPGAPSQLVDGLIEIMQMEPDQVARLPRLMRIPAMKVRSELSKANTSAFIGLLQDIRRQVDFTALDVVNAYTNLAHVSKSPWSIYSEINPMVSAVRDIIELEAVRQGVQAFESAA